MSAPGTRVPAPCRDTAPSWEVNPSPGAGDTRGDTSVQVTGHQHPACHPGSSPVLTLGGTPSPRAGTGPLSLRDLLGRKKAQEGKKKTSSYHVQQLRLPGQRETDSFQMAQ